MDLRARVQPYLPAGEQYVVAFVAVGGIAPRLAHRYRVVAVTETRIHLFAASLWRVGQPRRLLVSLPPGTVIESRRDFVYDEIHLGGERLWVQPAWQGELREAAAFVRAVHRPA